MKKKKTNRRFNAIITRYYPIETCIKILLYHARTYRGQCRVVAERRRSGRFRVGRRICSDGRCRSDDERGGGDGPHVPAGSRGISGSAAGGRARPYLRRTPPAAVHTVKDGGRPIAGRLRLDALGNLATAIDASRTGALRVRAAGVRGGHRTYRPFGRSRTDAAACPFRPSSFPGGAYASLVFSIPVPTLRACKDLAVRLTNDFRPLPRFPLGTVTCREVVSTVGYARRPRGVKIKYYNIIRPPTPAHNIGVLLDFHIETMSFALSSFPPQIFWCTWSRETREISR